MTRIYAIMADVEGIAPGRIDAVVDAIHRSATWEIPTEGWWIEEMAISVESDAFLHPGETGTEFALRLARSIWSTNSGYCPVGVTFDRVGRLGDEVFSFDESAYHRLVGAEPLDICESRPERHDAATAMGSGSASMTCGTGRTCPS